MHKQIACKWHGGTFETSPRASFGEVSSARPTDNTGGNRRVSKRGTTHAIDYSTLGVPADLTRPSGRGGARNRGNRESDALTASNVGNLQAATRHASNVGLPFTRMVTIHWQAAGVPLEDMARATGHYTDLLTKTLARHGSNTAYVWCHEGGERKGGHCHLLVHVPAEIVPIVSRLQRGWLRRITGAAYRKNVILSKPIGGRLGLECGNPDLHATNLEAALAYICKAAPQAILDSSDIERAHEPGGLVIGKRCGTSQNIGAKARERT